VLLHDNLWKKMWGECVNSQYKNEEQTSAKKMDLIKNSINLWGLGIGPNPQSPIPNPQSPIPIISFQF
jgi:hypothetical protein